MAKEVKVPTAEFEENLRRRFRDLLSTQREIEKRGEPLRQKRDEFVAETQALEVKIEELRLQIVAAEKGLVEVMNERAAIARALKGKTGVVGPSGEEVNT